MKSPVLFHGSDSCSFTPACPAHVRKAHQSKWASSQFQQLHRIGSGHASIVHLVWDMASQTYLAIKCYKGAVQYPDIAMQVCHEVELHSELDHPNILPLYGAFVEHDDIFLVMPYAHQGSVYHLLQKRTWPEEVLVAEIVLPFLAGLQYLHSKGYLHRDIKTENVLVDESGKVMIADFGLAMDVNACPAVHRVGTPVYMAPEVFRIVPGAHSATTSASAAHAVASPEQQGTVPADKLVKGPVEAHDSAYGTKADCWSAAVFVYEVLCGSSPFGHIRDRQALEHAILHAPICAPTHVSEHAAHFLMVALDRAPESRMSITDMLSHPWLVSAAAVDPKEPALLACRTATPPFPGASSAPGNHMYNRTHLPDRNESPRTVIGFAAPRGASSMVNPCLQSVTNPGVKAMPATHEQVSSLNTSSDSSVPSVFQAPVTVAQAVVKKPYATFEVATSPSSRPARTSDALRKCASASSCTLKHHEQNGSCGTPTTRISTSASAIPTPLPTSSLTLALLDQNVSSNRNSMSSHHSTDYSHSSTSSVLQHGAYTTPALMEGSHEAPRSLTRSTSGGAAPMAKVTIVYAAAEQGKTFSPMTGLGASHLPCISEATIEREALEAGCTSNSTPCTAAECFNPRSCASAGRCDGYPEYKVSPSKSSVAEKDKDTSPVHTPAELPLPAAQAVGQTVEECNCTVPLVLKSVTMTAAGTVHKSSTRLEPEGRDIVTGCSPDDDRTFEVRGSWGGSIDSTAGAAVARMMDRFRNCDFKPTTTDAIHYVSEQSDLSAWEFPWGAGLNSRNLCASCSAEFRDLNVLTEEEQALEDDYCRTCSEKSKPASVGTCSELQPGSALCRHAQGNTARSVAEMRSSAEQLLPALDLISATEHSAAIPITPQHLEVQEHATGSLALPETLGPYGYLHCSSFSSTLAVSGDKPMEQACAVSSCCAVKCNAPAGALSQALSGTEGLRDESVATVWQASSSRQSLHARVENTPSQGQLGVLRASPVYTEDTRSSSTIEGVTTLNVLKDTQG